MVASEVFAPPTISTRGIKCGGLNGWAMTQRSGWLAAPFWISLMVSPDELDAMMTSGANNSSNCPSSFCLKSIRSGPFSWTRSTPSTAWASAAVNFRFDCEASGERPNRLSAGQAASTKVLSAASAFGATSVATTCSPLARNSEVQLAPMTPVPIMAIRRMGLFCDISLLLRDFGVRDAGEVALAVEEVALTGPIEPRGVDRAGEIGHEHAVARYIERNSDPFHQMVHHDLWLSRFVIDRGPVHGVAARRVTSIGPVQNAILEVELEVDRLGQMIEEDFDIRAVCRGLSFGNFDVGAEDAAEAGIVGTLLSPIDPSELRI